MTALFEATLSLVHHNVHLYIMFAGTEWSRIHGTSSSRDLCSKVYIPFSRNYTPIAASLYPEGLHSETFQQCLFTIGSIPRNIVAYCREVQREHQRLHNYPRASALKMIRNRVCNDNSNQWARLGESMITLMAFSLSGVSVAPHSSPGIIVSDGLVSPTWQQMADRGLIALVQDCEGYTRVVLPYVAIQHALGWR
jgi:hypothetical protein